MHELGLQFLQPRFGLLPLGQVADEAGEEAPVAGAHLADRQLHREGRAVLALADDHAADADDAPLAGAQIALEIAVVALAVGRRHQHLDVLADHLVRRVAEQPRSRRAEGLHDPALVDDDHRVRHGVEDRAQMRFARERVLGARRCMHALRRRDSPIQAMPTPMAPNTAALTMSRRELRAGREDEQRRADKLSAVATNPGPSPPMPAAASTAGTKKQIERLVAQDGRQQQPDACRKRNGARRHAIARPPRAASRICRRPARPMEVGGSSSASVIAIRACWEFSPPNQCVEVSTLRHPPPG